MTGRRRLLMPTAVVVLVAGCSLGGSSSATDYSGQTVKLGVVLSMSGAGVDVGARQKKAIDLAADTVRADGVNGARLDVQVVDDGSAQDRSDAAFTAFAGDQQVMGIIGPTLPFTASTSLAVAQKSKIVTIAPSEPGKGIVGDCGFAGGCDYIFRDSLAEAVAIPANVKVAAEKKPKAPAILFDSDFAPGVLQNQLFRQAFADNGIPVPPGAEQRLSRDDTNIADPVTAVLGMKPDILLLAVTPSQSGAAIQEARKQGFSGPILGGDNVNSLDVSRTAGEAGAGVQSGSGYFEGAALAANRKFVDAYEGRYKDESGKPEIPDQAAAQAYSAVLLFAEAVRNAGLTFGDRPADRTRVKTALEKVTIDTPLGHFAFTGAHDAQQDVWVNAMDGKGGILNVRRLPAG